MIRLLFVLLALLMLARWLWSLCKRVVW